MLPNAPTLTQRETGERQMSNERIRLSDKEVADVIKLCEFVITSLGGTHDENIRARKVLKCKRKLKVLCTPFLNPFL